MPKNEQARLIRQHARRTAREAILGLSDDDLRNMEKELGRELNQRISKANEIRTRFDIVRNEQERRRASATNGLLISDHAILRYLERYKGVDIQAIREEIAAMATRAKLPSPSPQMYSKHKDPETNITLAINEATNTVTTVFNDTETTILTPP
jgi:hypothetical protein